MNRCDNNGWMRFRKNAMPTPGMRVLVWLDLGHMGFPVATKVEENGEMYYWNSIGRQKVKIEPSRCRWKQIIPPEGEIEG